MTLRVEGGNTDKDFEDVEEAIRYAVRSARRMREVRKIYDVIDAWVDRSGRMPVFHKHKSQEVATITPSGQVDFTFYGGSIGQCQNPRTMAELLA